MDSPGMEGGRVEGVAFKTRPSSLTLYPKLFFITRQHCHAIPSRRLQPASAPGPFCLVLAGCMYSMISFLFIEFCIGHSNNALNVELRYSNNALNVELSCSNIALNVELNYSNNV